MRRIGIITALALTAGCAQILGVDEEWTQPEEGAGPSTSSAASLASTSGAGAQGPGGAGGGLGAGGAECTSAEEMQGDAKNCGSCGHDCLGGACEGGVCKPVLIYDKEPLPSSGPISLCNLVVDESHVYLAVAPASGGVGTGVIVRLEKAGSEPQGGQTLASNQYFPVGLALDDKPDGYLYFAHLSYAKAQHVFRVKKNAGTSNELETVTKSPIFATHFLAHQSGKLFVTVSGPLQQFDVSSVPSAGAPVDTGESPPRADDVAVDDTYVYWLETDTTIPAKKIRRRLLAGGDPKLLADVSEVGAANFGRLARGGDVLYASSLAAGVTIAAVPTAGGPVSTFHPAPDGVWSLTADESHVYWTTLQGTSKAVYRKSKDAPESAIADKLAESLEDSPVVALDEDAVYWCAFQGAKLSVHKLAK